MPEPRAEPRFSREEPLYTMMGKRIDLLQGFESPDEWELVESIGEGTYGEVYKVRNIRSGEMAAAKVIDSVHEKVEEILPEIEVLRKYSQHPNIAGFYGAFIKKDPKKQDQLWLIMELCRGGSVTNLVRSFIRQKNSLDEQLIAYILHDTLKGVEHLHRHHVMHRDIKGPNVMLTTDAEIRLIDFGVSAEISNILMRRNSSVGTPFWMAPEVIACEQQLDYSYDIRCDIWSLGITAIELADGSAPFSDQHPMRALFKIPRSKPPTLRNPEKWSAEYKDFVARCLIKDFEKRPYAAELLNHPFVSWVPQKRNELRRKLMGVMDYQYQGRDGITDEMTNDPHNSGHDHSPVEHVVDHHRQRKSVRRSRGMLMVDDLATLSSLNEDIILSHLLERYLGQQIYTYIGDILIAVNPLQNLNIYTKQYSMMYRKTEKSSLPPHIFMVADMTYQAMIHNKTPQCCLISGESGAGKTVSANFLVQQLAELGKAGNRTLEEKILQVNPLMEALGNAQTVINDNSSRFGKYLELHFTSNGALTGAKLSEYLLEKSRVVSQSTEERNFHIFYYIIAGLAHQRKLEKYSFKPHSQHNYLQTGGQTLHDIVNTGGNRKKFEDVLCCLDTIGFSHEDVSSLLSIIAAIIHIGDIRFTEDETVLHISDKSMVINHQLLHVVSSLLCIDAMELKEALTTNSNVTRGETIVRNNTVTQAIDCRDAMAKALYGKLFSWIVHKINTLLNFNQRPQDDNEYRIGILDIFGFENFNRNSFEQLCINIANEQIQFYFNQQIFSWEQQEYRLEGLPLEQISFEDNRPLLDMFLQKPLGLLALLDEESRFPKASDYTLIAKFDNNITAKYYMRPKESMPRCPAFSISHYAGKVTYDATNFLEKNRDTLSPDIVHLLRTSENRLVRTLMQNPLSRDCSLERSIGLQEDADPEWWRLKTPAPPHPKELPFENGKIRPKDGWFSHLLSSRNRCSFDMPPQGRSSNSHPSFAFNNRQELKPLPGLLSLPEAKGNGNSASKLQQTVSMHFRFSLRDLLSKLLPSQSHFVRCIRPNDQMLPHMFDQEKVLTQLRYTGVLETTRIRRQGYSERIDFKDFISRYQVLAYPLHQKVWQDAESCRKILEVSEMNKWLMGRTKVFLKYYHVEKLAKLLEDHRRDVITTQRVARGWLARRLYQRLKLKRLMSIVNIQKLVRGFLARRRYKEELRIANYKASIIQQAYRRRMHSRRNEREEWTRMKRAVKIQSVVRGFLSRRRIQEELKIANEKAAIIQSRYRGHRVRKNYDEIRTTKLREREKRALQSEAVVALQAGARGYSTRKEYSKLQALAEAEETKMIFFLQQINCSWEDFHKREKEHYHIQAPHMAPPAGHRQSRAYEQPVQSFPENDPYLLQQTMARFSHLMRWIARSNPTNEAPAATLTGTSPPKKADREMVRVFPTKPVSSSPFRSGGTVYTDVRPKETSLNQRRFRKEIWSEGDESYYRGFAKKEDSNIQEKERERRISEMLLIVEGGPENENDGARPSNGIRGPARRFSSNAKPTQPVIRAERPGQKEEIIISRPFGAKPSPAWERKTGVGNRNWVPEWSKPEGQRSGQNPFGAILRPVRERDSNNNNSDRRGSVEVPSSLGKNLPKVLPDVMKNPSVASTRPYIPPPPGPGPPLPEQQDRRSSTSAVPPPALTNLSPTKVLSPLPLRSLSPTTTGRSPQHPEPILPPVPPLTEKPSCTTMYSHALRRTGNREKLLGIADDDDGSGFTKINFKIPVVEVS